MHRANADDPAIPEALAGVVAGIASLNDFQSQAALAHIEPAAAQPDFTTGSSHYDVSSLYSANIDGTGTSVAVVARSNLKLADVQGFRDDGPSVESAHRDPERSRPRVLSSDQAEATLDVEWAGAVA